MNSRTLTCLTSCVALAAAAAVAAAPAVRRSPQRGVPSQPAASTPMTKAEARTAIAMLDDAYSIILHEVHRTYHHTPATPVAAGVVREVQQKMTAKGWPASRFLAVNALAMNPEHQPKDEWERRTVAELKSGKKLRLETAVPGTLRVATTIPLTTGGCGSCHWSKDSMSSRAAIAWKVKTRD